MKGITYQAMLDTTSFYDELDSLLLALEPIVQKWIAVADAYECNDGNGFTPEELCL